MANILIVDDDPSFVHLLTNLIASFGETPISARQGANFFQIMEEESIDLILLDIYMPIVSGLTLIKQLKSNKAYQHIPVIMISGSDSLDQITQCYEAGASDFITKPISPVVLQARLTSALEKQKDIIRLKKEISERKKAESSLRKLSIAVEQSPGILFLTDIRHRIEYANPKCIEILGYKLDEIIGRSPKLFQAEAENIPSYDHIFMSLTKTDTWKGNICNQKKNGEQFWVSCSISPVLNNDGQVTNFLTIQEDISDRIKAEALLSQKTRSLEMSENRLRMIIEATNDGIVVVGQDRTIHFINPAAERLFGKSAKNLVGELFQYPLTPNQMTEIQIERSGQSDIVADLRVVSTETDDGLVWVASIREIKQPNSDQSEINSKQSDDIQISYPDKTHPPIKPERRESDLQHIQTDFISNMSHEFRTPMHAILSFASFGIKKIQKVPREKLLHYFEQIKLSANRLMPLIVDLLELYHLESGKRLMNKRSQDIVPIIMSVIREQQASANEKQIKISLISPQCKSIAMINKYGITKTLRNILKNAIHFSDRHTFIRIKIEHTVESEKEWLIVAISDEGIGIPEKELGNIFSKFYQCEQTRQHDGGTGIGLTICKHIVLEHGGKIWAKNNADKGACIYFSVPVFEEERLFPVINKKRLD
jgi:PAS domain S-box-containing protein